MKFYSDFTAHRTRQVVADLVAFAAIVAFVVLGVTVRVAVLAFGVLGAGLQSAGSGFRTTMKDAADALGNVPIIGSGVRAPFDRASDAGAALASAGADQQTLVTQVALVLGVLVAVVPIMVIVRVWLVRRIQFARRASESRTLASTPGGLDLLALRAMAKFPPNLLLAVHPDPAGAWRRGDTAAVRELSRLELTASGIRLR